MKKLLFVFIIAGMIFCIQGCSKNDDKNENDASVNETSQTSESSDEEQIYKIMPLLEGSFAKLYEQKEYYIQTDMTVESFRSPDTIFRYRLTVAIDKKSNKGMSCMTLISDDLSEKTINHLIIKDKLLYTIDDSEQTYKTESYKNSIESFGKINTTEQYLGISENLISVDSGQAQILLDGSEKKITADYERYRMSSSSSIDPSADDTYVTYYFKDKKPILEIMENSEGKTSFKFKTLSYKISDLSVFDTDSFNTESE